MKETEALKWGKDTEEFLKLYEVGLLCDMRIWFGGPQKACIILCGYLHVQNLLVPFKKLGFLGDTP